MPEPLQLFDTRSENLRHSLLSLRLVKLFRELLLEHEHRTLLEQKGRAVVIGGVERRTKLLVVSTVVAIHKFKH